MYFQDLGRRSPIALAVDVQRELGERAHLPRQHVIGKSRREAFAQLRGVDAPASHDGRDPARAGLGARPADRNRFEPDFLPDDSLDLLELDPVAQHLDLCVEPAQKDELAVGRPGKHPVTSQIRGPQARERHERSLGRAYVVEVSLHDLRTADGQLAVVSWRHFGQRLVYDLDPCRTEWAPDGDDARWIRLIRRLKAVGGAGDRRLGRAVKVVYDRTRRRARPRRGQPRRQRFPRRRGSAGVRQTPPGEAHGNAVRTSPQRARRTTP